jgi:hypothetical protein
MHTSLPLKALEAMFARGGTNNTFRVEGISGSVSEGFRIRSIHWGNPGEESFVQDVHVSYKGLWGLSGSRHVIFRDIHIGKAYLDVTGLEKLHSLATSGDSDVEDNSDADSSSAGAASLSTNALRWRPPVPASASANRTPFIQIDRAGAQDVFITNRTTGFSLSIPASEWTGFQFSNGVVELGALTIDSDRLQVATGPGDTLQIDGKSVSFAKKLQGTILPRLHPAVRQPIPFTLRVGFQTNFFWHLSAFEGGLAIFRSAHGSGFLRCTNTDLSAFVDAPVPNRLSVEIVSDGSAGIPQRRVGPGQFDLGKIRFEIQPATWVGPVTNLLTATGVSAQGTFRYQATLKGSDWLPSQALSADQAPAPDDAIGLVLYGKSVSQLDEAEKRRFDSDRGWFAEPRPAPNVSPQKPELESGR